MKRKDYEEAKALIVKIDDLSKSADMASEILKSLEKNSGSAKIFTHTGGRSYETEMDGIAAKAVFTEIRKQYNALIRNTKRLLDDLIDGTVKDAE